MIIAIGDIDVEVVKKDIKNIHLAVYPPHGAVRLAAPTEVADDTIRLFAISKLSWIKKQQRKFKEQNRQFPRKYISRETHYFLGKRYLLKVEETSGSTKVSIKNRNIIVSQVKPDSSVQQRKKVMVKWYREELKKVVPSLIDKWQKIIGVQAEGWGIRQMKTKWGTCNIEAKKIWLNLELVKKPAYCIEYIIAHELVHLLERNHNKIFITYMDKHMPKWKAYKEELNKLPVSY